MAENNGAVIKGVYLAVEIPKDGKDNEGLRPLPNLVFSKESMEYFRRRRKEWEKDAQFRSEWPYEQHFFHVDLANMKVEEVIGEEVTTA
jgi:hypothetical protein